MGLLFSCAHFSSLVLNSNPVQPQAVSALSIFCRCFSIKKSNALASHSALASMGILDKFSGRRYQ